MSNSKLIPADTPNDGLPPRWQAVVEPAIAAPQAPPAAFSSASPTLAASIPLNAQLVPDMMPTRYPGGMGGYRIFPPIPAGVPGTNAAIKSIIDNTPCCAPAPPPVEIGGEITICGDYTAGAGNIGELLSFHCQMLTGPTPLGAAQTCYNGTPPLEISLTVPAGGFLAGDTVLVGVLGGTFGTTLTGVSDSLGNNYAFIFNFFTGGHGGVFAAAYFVLTAPITAGTTYTITVAGVAISSSGESSFSVWRNLGAPQLGEVVFALSPSPFDTLNPSIVTTDNRALIAMSGYSASSISSGWVIETPNVGGFYPMLQAYWFDGTTSAAPPNTYSPTISSSSPTTLYQGAIIPFLLV